MKAQWIPHIPLLPSCFQFLEEIAWYTPAGSFSADQLLPDLLSPQIRLNIVALASSSQWGRADILLPAF